MIKSNLKIKIDRYASQALKQISILFQHVVISFLVFRFFVGEDSLSLTGKSAEFGMLIDGTAARPYVLRALIPGTIRLIRNLIPGTFQSQLTSFFAAKKWLIFYFKSDRAFEYAIALALSFLFFLGFSFVLRSLAKRFYPEEHFVQHLVVYGGMLILPLCSSYSHFIYDPATIFLFSFGTLLIVKNRQIPLLIFFPLLVLNKETSVLLILVFIAYQFRRMPFIKIVAISVSMGAIWFIFRMLVLQTFAANAGVIAEFHFFDHNLKLFGNPASACLFLLTFISLGSLIFYDWKTKDQFLRWGFIVVFCPLFFLSIFFGYIDEIRALYEAAPFAALLIAPSIAKLARS
jgi:hypothetical protein